MKVRVIMTSNVICCAPRTNAAAIAEICWSKPCGAVPVVDTNNKILGIVTDRDLFIALGTRNRRASDLVAEDVMSTDVATCSAEDDVRRALALMHERRVRRIPVVDRDRVVKGIVSLHDVVLHVGTSELAHAAVMRVMTGYTEPTASKAALATAQA